VNYYLVTIQELVGSGEMEVHNTSLGWNGLSSSGSARAFREGTLPRAREGGDVGERRRQNVEGVVRRYKSIPAVVPRMEASRR
jgi:hypothetical protein